MKIQELKLKGLKLIIPDIFPDSRGFFLESFREERYRDAGITCSFVQDNHSYSSKGCIRGMHFQSEPGQAKLVRCAQGKIFDVAVDIRPESPTYGQWEGVVLDGTTHQQLFVPVGFAHGFCVLSDHAHVMYKVSTVYDPQHEKGFRFDDPDVAIRWPLDQVVCSERDKQNPSFRDLETLLIRK